MARTEFDDFDTDDLEDAQGSDLVKKLRAKIDELSKSAKELERENSELKGATRSRSLESALTERGFSPKIAKFFPSDAEVDAESIDGWLADNAELFGGSTASPETTQNTTIVSDAHAAQRRMEAAQSGGSNPAVPNDLLAQIEQAESMESLEAILRGR